MKRTRIALVILQLLVALNAIGGGVYGLGGAKSVPASWLEGSPFHSYTIPSLFLLVVIAGGMIVAAAAWLLRLSAAPWLSLAMGLVLMAWIVVQVAIISLVSWMQPTSFIAGAAIAALAGALIRGGALPGRCGRLTLACSRLGFRPPAPGAGGRCAFRVRCRVPGGRSLPRARQEGGGDMVHGGGSLRWSPRRRHRRCHPRLRPPDDTTSSARPAQRSEGGRRRTLGAYPLTRSLVRAITKWPPSRR